MAVAVSDGDEVALYTFAGDGSDPAMVARIDAKDMADRRDRVSDPARIAMLAPVRPAWQMSYSELEQGYPFLYTMNSDGTDPRILAGWKEGRYGRVAWPVPVRLPADVEACSKGVVVPNPEENPGLVEDCRTLLEMRDQLAGSGTHAWSSDRGISGWPGVGVSGQPPRVRALYISDFSITGQLYGQIPPEIGNLEGLRELTIEWTHINGRIPREIGKLANLESLKVAFTHIGGSIPAEIGNLTNLKRLVLGDSQFSGSIPAETGKLVNLEVLDLQKNIISGHIPPEIGKLVNVKVLDLQANSGLFTGPIPPELGNMMSLEVLLLRGNRLSGSIPAELGNLTNLTHLDLGRNELSGCIPHAMRDLRNLQYSDYWQHSYLDQVELEYCEDGENLPANAWLD